MNNLQLFNTNITMSSLEISELTEKEHKNVLRDIDNTIKTLSSELSLGFKSSTYKDSTGKTNRMYELDYDSTMCLVSGYNPELRMKIIKRLKELEQEKALGNFKVPTTYLEAIEVIVTKEKERLILEHQIEINKPKVEAFDNSKVIFSKKEPVYDKERGYKTDIQEVYPFLASDKITLILDYYTKTRFEDTNYYVKEEALEIVEDFFIDADFIISPTKKIVFVKHPCLLNQNLKVKKDKAIKYLGYSEEDFQ